MYYPTHVKVQADQDDVYQIDVSTDETNWTAFYTVPKVSGSGLQTRDSGPLPAVPVRYLRVYATSGDGKYSVSEVQVFTNTTVPSCNGEVSCSISVAELLSQEVGGTPSAQDLEDLIVTWTCGSETTTYMAHAVPWNADALVSVICPPSSATCNPNQPTTCSVFAPIVAENGSSVAQQRSDDVVYKNVAELQLPICPSHYSTCSQVIAGKTNYYHTDSGSPGTHNDPACLNVQRAITDAIDEGSCPAGVTADTNTSWPYNLSLGSGETSTCLPYPVTQPALLPFIGCGPYVQ